MIGEGEFSPFYYSLGTRSYQSSSLFTNLVAGEYSIKLIDQRSCVQTKNIKIGLNTQILADFETEILRDYNELEFAFTGQ